MSFQEGGCLCGAIRYTTNSDPMLVMHCHCKFCQRATGAAYSVEPIFDKKSFAVIRSFFLRLSRWANYRRLDRHSVEHDHALTAITANIREHIETVRFVGRSRT